MTTVSRYGRTCRCGSGTPGSRTHHRQGRVQSLAGAAGRALHSSLHRHGLRLQRVLAAAVARARRHRSQGVSRHDARGRSFSPRPATGASPAWAGCTRCSSSCSACRPPLWGGWLERVRPAQGRRRRRAAAGAAASCSAPSASTSHQLWLMWLGSGVIGGIGLGLGYISPVSTLVKWFPDRRGMATGMAIMGFGGGAMIGAPLADLLDELFQDADLGRRVADLPRPWAPSISSS